MGFGFRALLISPDWLEPHENFVTGNSQEAFKFSHTLITCGCNRRAKHTTLEQYWHIAIATVKNTLNSKSTPLRHRPQSDQLPIVDARVGAVTVIVVHPADGEVAPSPSSRHPKPCISGKTLQARRALHPPKSPTSTSGRPAHFSENPASRGRHFRRVLGRQGGRFQELRCFWAGGLLLAGPFQGICLLEFWMAKSSVKCYQKLSKSKKKNRYSRYFGGAGFPFSQDCSA